MSGGGVPPPPPFQAFNLRRASFVGALFPPTVVPIVILTGAGTASPHLKRSLSSRVTYFTTSKSFVFLPTRNTLSGWGALGSRGSNGLLPTYWMAVFGSLDLKRILSGPGPPTDRTRHVTFEASVLSSY